VTSFADPKFDEFVYSQKELELVYKKDRFEKKLKIISGDKEQSWYFGSDTMKKLFEEFFPTSKSSFNQAQGSNSKQVPIDNSSYGYDTSAMDDELRMKVSKILQKYAEKAKKVAQLKSRERELMSKTVFLQETCLMFKSHLIDLDQRYSQ